MSQGNIQETLQSILCELHGNQYCMEKMDSPSGTLTALEIAHILLGQAQDQDSGDEHKQQMIPASKVTSFMIDQKKLDEELSASNRLFQIHYYRPIYSCRKFIGGLLVFGKKVVRKLLKFLIEPVVEEQNQFNAAIVRSLNVMRNNHVVFQAAIDFLCDEMRQQKSVVDNLKSETSQAVDNLKSETSQAVDKLKSEASQAVDTLSQKTQAQLKKLQQELQTSADQLRRQTTEVKSTLEILKKIQKQDDIYETIDYFKFQEHMRGSYSKIKAQQQEYVNYFAECSNVIDLGCGRGEFLEVLHEHGINATGVDSYGESVNYCRMRGLQVVQGDAIEYLMEQKTESIDGVFAAQLIEHIPMKSLLELCKESYRVMKPESYIILETPNPMCLSVYMNSFYLDPSHKNPVHPHLMEYLMKECGFHDVHVVFPEASKVGYRFPLLDAEHCMNLAEFNDGVNLLSDIMFGSQDYAIIAKK